MKYFKLFIFTLSMWCMLPLIPQAQNTVTTHTELDVQVTYAQKIGKTLPVRDLVPMRAADPEKRKRVKLNKQAPSNFAGRGKYVSSNPDALPQGPDAVWQQMIRSQGIEVEPLVNVEGLDSGSSPQDPSGDIGRNFYVQAINATLIGVYDLDGEMVSQFTANTIWNSIGFSSAGDPIILFDQEAQRWIITEFPSGNQLLVAISETSDPLGSYSAYNFGTPSFPDYPKYGIWSNAYSVTTNEQGPSNLPSYFINREQLLNEEETVMIQRIVIPGIGSGPGFQVATPVDWSGLTPPAEEAPIILTLNDDAWGASAQDQIDIHTFELDWDNPDNTTLVTTSVVTSPFDTRPYSAEGFGFACIPQLNGTGLDGLPEVIMNQVHYRNFGSHEAMVLNFITDVTGDDLSGIRWVELRRVPGGDWSLYQEGTFAPDDGKDRFMGAICMDGAGNIGLAYAISSAETYAGLRFTGRRASDPLGEMTVDEYVIVEGLSTLNTGARFGDYAHMSVDPDNDRTFWFTAEYAGANGNATRIVAFELTRDTTDIAPVTLNKPENNPDLGDMEAIEIVVQNLGLDTPSVFEVGYIFEDQPEVIEPVNFTLYPDSSYTHTFASTVDMSVVGDYEFKLFTTLNGDQTVFNDTLRVVRSKLARFDASITSIDGLGGTNCGDLINTGITLSNFGAEPLTSVTITIELNGEVFETIEWEGELLPGESTNIGIILSGFVDGSNTIIATTSNPNGMADEIPDNDSFTRPFDALTDGVAVYLQLTTDNYPEETTWEVISDNGDILYAGGPYSQENTLIIEEFCLDPEACYTFAIYDSYGDGICCSFGQGNYILVDADGQELLNGDGDFNSEEISDFCATFMCMMDAEFSISPESGPGTEDGALMITPLNGVGPYQYSIDGGNTFSDNNFFAGLPAGEYEIFIDGENDCEYTGTVTIPQCALDIFAEVTDAMTSDTLSGVIEVGIINGALPYQFSIDGGVTFQDGPTFEGLGAGIYDVVVQDELGCEATLQVTVGLINSTSTTLVGHKIEVSPNPTDGIFRVSIAGLQQRGVLLPLEIINSQGQTVQVSNLTNYNGVFTGQLSLYAYPDGVYYVRFKNKDLKRMVKIVKQ
ncbi:MAG: T9SS type A sorting domain-containing protein [Chitinophagales bacterium]|nr:T9SS type A sorting domain-containing protein [Chitinophagales bacterium]